ncbi:(Dimethylallyl)adenosine tRNA methylthiotransferase MiaB [Planctomycetales bacterium 10988]|nr:(Dimethylallyl)adenosine tRNA methylthiotransferase MiaB [Planctomycetales bacterium 10988]
MSSTILFLEIDTESEWAVASIGPAYLAAYLRQHGHLVEGIRIPVHEGFPFLQAEIEARKPDLLALSLTSRQWHRGKQLMNALRDVCTIPVIAGGLHPTFSPEEVLAEPGFDFICLGEGEEALLELVEALQSGVSPLPPIRNIWAKGKERPELRPSFEQVDELPFAARDLLDEPNGVAHISTQRGCPFPCTYCAARQFHELYGGLGNLGNYGRRRSHENVFAELEDIRKKLSLHYVIFLDDTFTIRQGWVKKFCQEYKERFRVPFSLHARADTVTESLLQDLAGAGCAQITYGIESGSPRLRREVMKRAMTDETMIEAVTLTKKCGIRATTNFMLGLPDETAEDMELTFELLEKLKPDDFYFFIFYPFPGTHLYQYCLEKNYLPENYLELPVNHHQSILTMPQLSKEAIEAAYERFIQVREKHFLNRFHKQLSSDQLEEVKHSLRKTAMLG